MLSIQINDHLFPEMTEKPFWYEQKVFENRKNTLQNAPRGEQTRWGTEHPRTSLAKIFSLLPFRGITKPGPKGSHWREGVKGMGLPSA